MNRFKIGDRVLWTDPDPEGSGVLAGMVVHCQYEGEEIDDNSDEIISVDFDDGGSAECLSGELTKVLN